MFYLLSIILLVILFYLLGKTADHVVTTTRRFCASFGVNMFILGLILGFFTSLPEVGIGINALVNDVPEMSLGNLLGSFMVLLGLICGMSIILNRGIATDGKTIHILPIVGYVLLPILFGLDGVIGRFESILIVLWYAWIIVFLSSEHQETPLDLFRERVRAKTFLLELFVLFFGVVSLLLISNIIVQISEMLLQHFNISEFLVGLVLFSIGTNLPEISVMIRAWKTKAKDLSMSHLLGSVIADPFLIGVFGFMTPFVVPNNPLFMNLSFFAVLLLGVFMLFYRSGKRFSRLEGAVLVGLYFLFLASEITLSFF